MKENGLVSVIICTLDRPALLTESIESVLKQTYQKWELLVVDNGLRAGTEEVVRKFGDRVRHIKVPTPGLSNARNEGIRAAKGEYVAFLDDDDLWSPDKLEKQMAAFARNPKAVLCYCDSYLFHEPGRADGRFSRLYRPRHGNVLEDLVRESFAVCSTLVARRGVLEQAGPFKTHYQISEEYDWMLRLAPLGEFEYVDEPLVWYRFHPGQAWRQKRARMWEETIDILEDTFRRNPDLSRRSPALYRSRLAESYLHLGLARLREHAGNAATPILKALAFGPHRVVQAVSKWAWFFLQHKVKGA